MDELITWLRAALDADEQVAHAAAILPYGCAEWFSGAEGCVFGKDPASELHVRGAVLSLDDIGAHIARWDPARVLRELKAKRAMLHAHGQPHECIALTGSGKHSVVDGQPWELWEPRSTEDNEPCLVVRLLAQPYAGRDGWREEWRVQS